VPLEKERVVIERVTSRRWQGSCSGSVNFGEGEVARMEIYEETLTFTKKHLCVKKSKSRKWWNRKQLKHKKQLARRVG